MLVKLNDFYRNYDPENVCKYKYNNNIYTKLKIFFQLFRYRKSL